jgi:hypothetical protein
MKKGLLRKCVLDYLQLLNDEWRKSGGGDLVRKSGAWVQVVSLNASRFDDRYVPRCSLMYLKELEPAGAILGQELKGPQGTQRWVSVRDHEQNYSEIYLQMIFQFRPALDGPILEEAVCDLLLANSTYLPHAYVLALMALDSGNLHEFKGHRQTLSSFLDEADNPYVRVRLEDLDRLAALSVDRRNIILSDRILKNLQAVRA